MPVYKCQILLGTADAGWSETYHISEASHAAAMTKLDTLCTARMKLSKSDVKVRTLRVSDVAVKGDSFLQPATAPEGTYAAVGAATFDPAVALQINGYSADHLAWTHWFIRGLPNDQINTQEPFQLAAVLVAPWPADLTAFKAAIVANVQLYTKKPNPPGTLNTVAIATTGHNTKLPIRRAGRPFALRHGRRVIV